MPTRVITCGICFNVLNHPLRLHCSHSFCSACVRLRLNEGDNGGFHCPLCATPETVIDSHNLHLYADRETEEYIEVLGRGTWDPLMCQWCDTTKATIQCGECMCAFCEDCCIAVHRNSAKRHHAFGKLSESNRRFQRRCQLRGHEEYRTEFFCTRCQQVCCAYCLQVGPHRDHTHVTMVAAAAEARQQLTRDMHALAEVKNQLEQQALEMNRVFTLYLETYDAVENTLTERFEVFKQQLMERELEARRTLTHLRTSGDTALTASRGQYLDQLNSVNETLLQYRRLHNNGTDEELLKRQLPMNDYSNINLPSVRGSGFRVVDTAEMTLSSLEIGLDLHTIDHPYPTSSSIKQRPADHTADRTVRDGGWSSAPAVVDKLPPMPLRLTFPLDEDVEATMLSEGVRLRCVARDGPGTQIGVRSKEIFKNLLNQFPEDRGLVSWQIRLDSVLDSFIGVVEKTTQGAGVPEGFYWRPASAGVIDGRIGRYTSAVHRLPVCGNGDVVRFLYDGEQCTLRIIVNDTDDRGLVVTELHSRIAACFIFFPGEALTLLF